MIEFIIFALFLMFVIVLFSRVMEKINRLQTENILYRETLENIAYNDTDCALSYSEYAETEAKEALWRIDNHDKR